MEITEVRVFLKEAKDKKLKAYAAVTFDNAFVVRNIKIIEGSKGLFVAMPSRKLRDVCQSCSFTNPVRAKFCNECGKPLPVNSAHIHSAVGFNRGKAREVGAAGDESERQSDHRDIAHPITPEFRDYLQQKVLNGYSTEKTKVGVVVA